MYANTQALGRNHSTADVATLTEGAGLNDGAWFRVDLRWEDGAHVSETHDTKAEAIAHLTRLGWVSLAARIQTGR